MSPSFESWSRCWGRITISIHHGLCHGGCAVGCPAPDAAARGARAGAVSLVSMQEDLKRQLRSGDASQEAVTAFLAQKTPVLTEALWRQNVVDIEATVSAVVAAVLQEPGVGRDTAAQRAKALKKLGVIFQVKQLPARSQYSCQAKAGGGGLAPKSPLGK